MNIKEIRELIELIERSNIEEFEMERSGVRIRISKTLTGPVATQARMVAESPSTDSSDEIRTVETPEEEGKNHIFTAPLVGTFYLTPKPDAEPFVKSGDHVTASTVLCIIEAMKIFNQIESDIEGDIIRILVENGQPVEYGQPLFEIQVNS